MILQRNFEKNHAKNFVKQVLKNKTKKFSLEISNKTKLCRRIVFLEKVLKNGKKQ